MAGAGTCKKELLSFRHTFQFYVALINIRVFTALSYSCDSIDKIHNDSSPRNVWGFARFRSDTFHPDRFTLALSLRIFCVECGDYLVSKIKVSLTRALILPLSRALLLCCWLSIYSFPVLFLFHSSCLSQMARQTRSSLRGRQGMLPADFQNVLRELFANKCQHFQVIPLL